MITSFSIGPKRVRRRRNSAPNGAPSALTVTVNSDTAITLNWTIGSTNHDGHRIYISTDGVTFTANSTVLGATATKQVTGLTAGALYYFYVVAYKDSTESTATNIYDTYFKITVDTTKAGSANDTFILPTAGAGTYDYYVDWGDGAGEQHVTVNTSQTKDYGVSGTYQIKIRGTFPRIYFNNVGDKAKLITIDNWGNIKWSSMANAFHGCSAMQGAWIDTPNMTTANFSLLHMFDGCTIFNYSVDKFNLATATNLGYLFTNCTAFNKPVPFNTANVDTFANMFLNCSAFNQSVATFNTIKGIAYQNMFYGCTAFNQSVANFNTAAGINLSCMFYNCFAFQQSLATFTIGTSATSVNSMLQGCDINLPGTTTNYDATLVAWATADVPNSLNFHGGTSKYSAAGGGTAARASLETDDLWTITDGGEL